MQKIIKEFWILALLLSVALSGYAYDFEVNGIYYSKNSDGKTVYVTFGKYYYSGRVVIPSEVSYEGISYSVTSIGTEAFEKCSELTSVTIPYSVTSIGDYAFSGCSGLKSVTIPNSVTSIGGGAFSGCSGLKSVTIPNSVTSIGDYAFSGCSGLTSVTIPNSVTWIGQSTFESCSGLTSVTIPNSVTSIGNKTFAYCSKLTSITIPNSVTKIGGSAFKKCSGLKSVTIPNSVTSIGSYAFENCSGLKQLTIQDGTSTLSLGYNYYLHYNSVGEGLFYDAPLESVYLGRNLSYDTSKSCGYSPFYGKSTIKELTIGNSVTSIGDYAFYNCSGLTSVVFNAENCTTMGSSGSRVFYGCSNLTSLTIGANVKTIPSSAFLGCSGLTSVTIPNSVTSIGNYAFKGCSGIKQLTIKDGTSTLSLGYNLKSSLGEGLFYDAPLESVYLGRNLSYYTSKSCGYSPFFNKSTIIKLTIGNKVTSIGDYTFSGCSKLTSVTIPNSVTSIGDGAFYNCSGLKQLTIKDGTSTLSLGHNSLGEGLFYDAPLESVYLGRNLSYDNYTMYGNSPFYGKSTIKELTIGNSVTSIGDYAFEGCRGLTSVTIPNSVTSIGRYALAACNGLTSVTISNSVTKIEGYAFSGCSGLTGVTIPNSVTSIGEFAFSGCSGLTWVTIPNSVTSIGDYVFSECNLAEVTSLAVWPPTIMENTFSQSSYDNATLYVYEKSAVYYRENEFWQNFYNVETLSGGPVIEPVQLSVLFPDRGRVKIAVPCYKTVTLTVLPNDVAEFGLSSATFNGVEITDELDENHQYTTPVLKEDAVLSVVYVIVDSGIDQSLANRIKVSASNGTVRVQGAAPESEVLVRDLSGKIVRRSTEKTFRLGEGIYVLNVEGLSFKFSM